MSARNFAASGVLVLLTCMCAPPSDSSGTVHRVDLEPGEYGVHATQTKQTDATYQLTHLAVFTYVWGPGTRARYRRDDTIAVRFWFGLPWKEGRAHQSIVVKTEDLGPLETDYGRATKIPAHREAEHLQYGQAKNLPMKGVAPRLYVTYDNGSALGRERSIASSLDCDGNLHKKHLESRDLRRKPQVDELRRGLVVAYVCSRIDAVQNGFAACVEADRDCDGAITLADLDDFEVDLEVVEESVNIFDSCAGFRKDLGFSPDWGSWGPSGL